MTWPASCGKGLQVHRSCGPKRPPSNGCLGQGSGVRANGLWACRRPRELTACEPRGSDSDGAKLTAARAGTDAVGPGGRGN
jgi:hypothetical protein